jgi:hypothetical protein
MAIMNPSDYAVAGDSALKLARYSIPSFVRPEPPEVPFEQWSVANFEEIALDENSLSDPLEIFDAEKRLLFRDYSMELRDGSELRVRTAASKVLGNPIISVGVAPGRLPIRKLSESAREVAREMSLPLASEKLVCYAYPKLGLSYWSEKGQWIIDLFDHFVIEKQPCPEISRVWSFYDRIEPEQVSRLLADWEEVAEQLSGLDWHGRLELEARVSAVAQAIQENYVGLTLSPQKDLCHCAPASAQMILNHYGINRTQEDIAAEMHTDDQVGFSCGTDLDPERQGYERLGGDQFEAVIDNTPTFQDAKDAIDRREPLRAGGMMHGAKHATAVGGWRIENRIQKLQVFDPYPPSVTGSPGGCVWLDSWLKFRFTEYIFFTRKPA